MSAVVNENTAVEFADLPPEIVSNILALLPSCDLKSSRLVNKQWYDASLAFNVLASEVLQFPPHDDFRETFEKSRRDFPHLKVLRGDKHTWAKDWFWAKVKPKVKSLSFEKCDISEHELFSLLANCPMLESLQFKLCDFRGEEVSTELSELNAVKLPRLKTLTVIYGPDNDVDILHKIADCAPKLELLALSDIVSQGESTPLSFIHHAVSFFARNSHRHVRLSLNFKFQISDHTNMGRLAVLTQALQYKGMQINGLVGKWSPALFEHTSTLQHLDITTDVTDEAFSVICGELRTLTKLSLQRCSNVVNGVEKLASLTNLRSLTLRHCAKISEESIMTGLCSRVDGSLRAFCLSGLKDVSDSCFIELARCHPAMNNLQYHYCCIGREGLVAISLFQPLITKLRLNGCSHADDEVLTSLSRLKDLKHLELSDTKVLGVPFEDGLKLPVLQSISLNDTEVSEKSFRCLIQNHKSLVELEAYGCGVNEDNLKDLLTTRPGLQYWWSDD